MPSITYRRLLATEAKLIREIDRTERVRIGFRVEHDKLLRMDVVWDTSPWQEEGDEHSFPHMIRFLKDILRNNGTMLGAFDGDRLVGMAAFRPHLSDTTAQLALLHVSNGYRRLGIASHFFDEIVSMAFETGATQLYVSATPSESAVGFYTSRGFVWTQTPHPELFALEPEDIHMIKPL
jgi:ribosomal protein S18 acetylase RimI-like enzyme